MANNLGINWFNPAKKGAELKALNGKCANHAKEFSVGRPPEYKKSALWAGLGCGGLMLLVIGGFVVFMLINPKKEIGVIGYVMQAMFVIVLPLVGGFIAYRLVEVFDQVSLERFTAFKNIQSVSPNLKPLYGVKLGPCSFPLVFDNDRKQPAFQAWLTGEHLGCPLNWVDAPHTIDPDGPKGSMINRKDRIIGRAVACVVFQQQLPNVPDLFVVRKSDVLYKYLDHSIKSKSKITNLSAGDFYAITSDGSRAGTVLSPALVELLKSTSNLAIQVVGGVVVVTARPYSAMSAKEMFTKPEKIKAHLDAAVSVFKELQSAG